MDSQARNSLVWGGLLVLFGAMALVQTFAEVGAWVWVAVLAAGGLGVFAVFLTDRSQWAILIPAYVMWVLALLIALLRLNLLRDEVIATYVLTAVALPFLVVFLRDRSQTWALIPMYVLAAVGLMVGLIGLGVLDDLLIPAYVMFAVAIPFFVVYARNTTQWWALIPGGIMAVIGASFLIAEDLIQFVAPAVLLVAGVWILARQFIRKTPS